MDDLEGIVLSETSQTEKETPYDLTDMRNLKKTPTNPDLIRYRPQTDGCQRRRGVGKVGKIGNMQHGDYT